MATGDEQYDDAIGNINGINTIFYVNFPYQPGSVREFLNGQLISADDDDGFIETDPSSGEIQTKIPPEGGLNPDRITFRYLEA